MNTQFGRYGRAAREPASLRVAIVHDWLPLIGGAERVLQQLLRLYPQADVYTLFNFLQGEKAEFLSGHRVFTSFLQRLPAAPKLYRHYAMLFPMAVEQFDLSDYDLSLIHI